MLDFDLMLYHVGEFGLYQKILFIFQAPFCMFVTFVLFGQLFLTLYPSVYWCEDHFKCPFGNVPPAIRRDLSVPFVNGRYDPCNFNVINASYIHSLATFSRTLNNCSSTAPCMLFANRTTEVRAKRAYYGFVNTVTQAQYTARPRYTSPTVMSTTAATLEPSTTAAVTSTLKTLIDASTLSTMGAAMSTGKQGASNCSSKETCPSPPVEFRPNVSIVPGSVISGGRCRIEECRVRWDFNTSGTPYETIVTEGNWWCNADVYVSASQAIFFVGAIVGGFLIGYIADTVGRVPALVIANLLGAIGGALSVVSSNFWLFMVFRFITGMAFDNCFTMMYILVLEFSGPRYRTLVANLSIAIFYTFGTLILPILARNIGNWKIYGLVISLPMFSGLLALFIVPESARWLLSKGRATEATEILRSFAKVNRKEVDERIFVEFEQSAKELYEQLSTEEDEAGILDVFKTPRLRRTFILLVMIWSLIALVYDGHSRNILNLANEDWSVFTMFTIASMTEFPADMFLIFTLDVFGRRWLSFGTLVLSGMFSLIAATVPLQLARSVGLIFAILSRFFVNIGFNIGLQYAAELLPTVIRAQGVNAIHIMGYVASIISPFVAMLGRNNPALSLILLGACSILAGALCLLLCETLGEELPNTIEEAEAFGEGQSFWNCPACGKGGRKDDDKLVLPIQQPVQLRSSLMATRRGETYRSSIISSRSSRSYRNLAMNQIPAVVPPNETTKLRRNFTR